MPKNPVEPFVSAELLSAFSNSLVMPSPSIVRAFTVSWWQLAACPRAGRSVLTAAGVARACIG
eukprot:COSAG01_NODE_271_length_19794_cov_73.630890_9_plen_63_part_00